MRYRRYGSQHSESTAILVVGELHCARHLALLIDVFALDVVGDIERGKFALSLHLLGVELALHLNLNLQRFDSLLVEDGFERHSGAECGGVE